MPEPTIKTFEEQVPPLSPDALLVAVGRMPSAQFEALRTSVHSSEGYENSRARCKRLSPLIGLPESRVRLLLSVLRQIYEVINDADTEELSIPLTDVVNSFRHLSALRGEGEAEFKRIVLDRVELLTHQNAAVDRLAKLDRLRSGLIRNAVSFSSMVDLRPDFSADRKAINGLLPMIQVQISTDATPAKDREFVFQMSVATLRDLEKLTQDIRAKVDRLMSEAALSQLLIHDDKTEPKGD